MFTNNYTMEVFEMIEREMNRQHWSKAKLAQKLNKHPTTIHLLLHSKTIHVPRLIELSEIFQYNFFREIAASMPYKEPVYDIKVDEDALKAPLLEQIKNLQLEVSILRQTLKDVVSR